MTTVNVRDERMYQMNPMFVAAVTAILRHLLGWLSGYLVAWGIWEQDAAAMYVGAAAMALVTMGWSLWEKYRERQKLLVAAGTIGRMSERQVEAAVRDGLAPPITTPKNVVVPVWNKATDQL